MKSNKFSKLLGVSAGPLMLGAVATTAFADLAVKNWRLFSVQTDSAAVWDIDKAPSLDGGGVWFPFAQTNENEYAVYLLANYNSDLTARTISATVVVDVSADTLFFTRSTACANDGIDAYVRLEFQTVAQSPNYSPDDYWWSTDGNSLNLTALELGPQTLTISTGDLTKWSNLAGQLASDRPAAFANALKHVKAVSVSFGSACRYASGVAVTGGGGKFELLNYTIAP